MGFMTEYKRLEKLCGDIMKDERKVSAYIDEMESLPRGASLVENWIVDLKQLKHYRRLRNQIAHDPDCTEESMCDALDTRWIVGFYNRIMQQTDPLALYHQAVKPHTPATKKAEQKDTDPRIYGQPTPRPVGCATIMMCAVLTVAAFLIWFL